MAKAFIPLIFLFLSISNSFAATIEYWNTQRKGANFFSRVPNKARFQDAVKAGIGMGRLAPNKWLNGRAESELGDFLLGPKDQYKGLVEKDLNYLKKVLDDADQSGLKIVFTMLSLPGSRWLQHNCKNGKCQQQFDLFKDFKYHQQAASFWRDLAKALKGHPAIVGFNIINEPCPERATDSKLRDWYTGDYNAWYKQVKGTPADLNLFYQTVIKAIREVDQDIPIILDGGFYANPYALQVLTPDHWSDQKILYAIHSYEPVHFTTENKKNRFSYPGKIPTGELDAEGEENAEPPFAPVEFWGRKKFDSFFAVVNKWIDKYKIPSNRIYVEEFGGYRESKGMVDLFKDQIDFYNSKKWHWSFYSFREDDGFPQMDYELGQEKLPSIYWSCSENYTCEKEGIYKPGNSLWQVLLNGLK